MISSLAKKRNVSKVLLARCMFLLQTEPFGCSLAFCLQDIGVRAALKPDTVENRFHWDFIR